MTESNRVRDLRVMLNLRYGVQLKTSKKQKSRKRYRLKDLRTGKYIYGKGKPVSYDQIIRWIDKHGFHPYVKNIPDDYKPENRQVYAMPLCVANHWQPGFTTWEFDPRYDVTDTGHIVDTYEYYFYNRYVGGDGYYFCNVPILNKEKASIMVKPHRYVALFFCPNRKNKSIVHHIDINKLNNDFRNLLWVTDAEHKELHKIYESGNMDKYYNRIAEILRDNKGE